jgi:hypothetical protein
MAFVRVIEDEHSQIEVFHKGNAWAVIIDIGYDDVEPLTYSLVVGLEPMGGGAIEYYFQVVEANLQTEHERTYWVGKDTAFIESDDRAIILRALLAATRALLDNARPERVEVVTYESNPPEKALVKHLLIGRVFEDCGYAVHTADPYHGKRVWWMERTS